MDSINQLPQHSPGASAYAPNVEFRVLGPVEVLEADVRKSVGGPKQRTVLALIVANAGQVISTDRIIEGTWGEEPPTGARRSLHTYISNLRGELGDVIGREGEGYVLTVEREAVDWTRFEDLTAAGAELLDENPAEAARILREGLKLWRGHPFADVDGRGEFEPEITRLSALRLSALQARIEADLALGRHLDVIGELEALTAEHPLLESFRAQQMLALYRAGRQAEALRAYERTRSYLAEELGINPTTELSELEQQILDHDPALDFQAGPTIQHLSVLIADLGDPSELTRLDPVGRDRLVTRMGETIESAVGEAGGSVFAQRGTAYFARFDDVVSSIVAAAALLGSGFDRAATPRIAVDVGDVQTESTGELSGPPVARAASLVAAAHSSQVLLSGEAQRVLATTNEGGWQVRALGSHRLVGLDQPESVYQLMVEGRTMEYPPLRTDVLPPRLPGAGRDLPGYELRDRVGSGAFGDVYRAYQATVGREVAVKVIKPELANQPSFVRRFEVEAQLVARLEHPHIVPLYDYWRDPDGAFLVMRWIRGGSLEDLLARGPLEPETALRILQQVGDALETAHRSGVIHRDVKATNVLLDEVGNAYLTDFGIAQGLGEGTPVSVATDVGAFGALISDMLNGNAPAEIKGIIDRATAADPSKEFSSVAATVTALQVALGAQAASIAREFTPTRNPYKGLAAFTEADADDFHGREASVAQVLGTLAESRLVAVVGPSGIGKSSVVRAGVIPALRGGDLAGSPNWLITAMLPGRFPFEELGTALLRIATESPPDLDEDLRRDERGLARATKRMLPPDGDLLLVIDQFEELFTLTDEITRDAFLAALTTLVADERSGARVIVTIRADYFDRPLRHPGLGELLRAGTVPVGAPSSDELLAMVTQPAAGVGVDFEPGLAEHIVSNVVDQPGGLPLLEYALTELFEARASDEIAAATYEASGGVLGALGRRAESTYQAMAQDQQQVAQQTFLRLVTVDESGRHTRRRVRRSELEGLDATTESVDTVLAAFGEHRLLTFDRDPITRGRTIEVAHEALFSEWQRLSGWIDEQREDLLLRRRLADEVQEWEQAGRADAYLLEGGRLVQHEAWSADTDLSLTVSEKDLLTESRRREDERSDRRRRRRRGILTGFATAAVIGLVLATFAFISRQDARESAELADQQAALAQESEALANQEALAATASAERADLEAQAAIAATEQAHVAALISRSGELNEEEPEVALLLALEAQRRAPGPDTHQAVLNALSRSLLGTRIATFDRFNEEIVAGDYDQISRDGLSTSSFEGDVMFRRSLVTGEAVEVGLLPEPDTRWVGDQDTGRRYAGSLDATRHWFSPYDGPWGDPIVPDQPMQLLTFPGATFAADRLVFITPIGTYVGDGLWDVTGEPLRDVFLVNATTGEPVGAALEGLIPTQAALSSDNELIAVSSARASTFGDEGAVFVLDAETGTEIFHMQVPAGVAALVIDISAREVVAGTEDGRVITIDLDAQEIVADVAISVQSPIADIGLRPDGRVVVVSDAKAELVDRRLGPIPGAQISLQGAVNGFVRADGTVIVTDFELGMDVHDFDRGALVEQAVEVGVGAFVPFLEDGSAGVLGEDGTIELVDVATGDRSTSPVVTPEGEFFFPIHPGPNGFLGINFETSDVARWEDGQIVERIRVASEDGVESLRGSLTPGRIANVGLRPDGTIEALLVNSNPGELEVLLTVEVEGDALAHPAPDDGLYVVLLGGGRFQTYDKAGSVTDELETGLFNLYIAVTDESSGKVAFAGAGSIGPIATGTAIVDPATREVQIVPDANLVANLTFARNGELLVIVSFDGSVRLWDVEQEANAGVIPNGSIGDSFAPLWYDETTDSIWVQSSGRLVRLPLSPERWVERACELVGRDFTQEEWDGFVPGDQPLQSACV